MAFETVDEKDPTTPKRKPLAAQKKEKVEGIRSAMMAIDKAMGMSIKEIAETFEVSPARVKQALNEVEEQGFVEHYRRAAFDRLAPKVLAVYEAHLEQGNLQAARDLAQGLGILQTAAPKKTQEKAITTLAEWRAEKEEEGSKDAGIN